MCEYVLYIYTISMFFSIFDFIKFTEHFFMLALTVFFYSFSFYTLYVDSIIYLNLYFFFFYIFLSFCLGVWYTNKEKTTWLFYTWNVCQSEVDSWKVFSVSLRFSDSNMWCILNACEYHLFILFYFSDLFSPSL